MFGMLLDLYTHAGMFPASELILQHMCSLGHTPDLATYTALVAAYMRYGHYSRALEICGDMKEAGLSVDTSLKAQIEAAGELTTPMI
jgi:pentatricopeptide repeat protein